MPEKRFVENPDLRDIFRKPPPHREAENRFAGWKGREKNHKDLRHESGSNENFSIPREDFSVLREIRHEATTGKEKEDKTENVPSLREKGKHAVKAVGLGATGWGIHEGIIEPALIWYIAPLVTALATAKWGFLLGTPLAFLFFTMITVVVDLLLILIYDLVGKDLFGAEMLKRAREPQGEQGWFMRQINRLAKRGDGLAFVLSSIFLDPVKTVIYMSKGVGQYKHFNKENLKRNLKIFFGSTLISNAAWIAGIAAVISAAPAFFTGIATFIVANPMVLVFLVSATAFGWGLNKAIENLLPRKKKTKKEA